MLFASWLSSLARLSNLSAKLCHARSHQGRIRRDRRVLPLIAIEQLEDRSLLTAPVITPPSFPTFSENTSAPTTLGVISAYDPDGGMGMMLSLSAADPIFSLDSSGMLSLQGPFTQPSYSLSVYAMDDDMEMSSTSFTISVSDDNNDGIIGDTFTGGGGGDTTTGGGGGDTTTGGGGGDTVVGGGGGGGFPTMPGNQAPDAISDGGPGFTTDEDTTFTTPNLLANDSDPDGDPISISMIGPSMYGFSTANSDGTVTYTPSDMLAYLRLGQTITDNVSYTITDGRGAFDTSSFSITITGVNDEPSIVFTAINFAMDGWMFNASSSYDPEGDPVTFAWEINGISIPMTDPTLELTGNDLIDLREFVGSSHTIKVIVSDGMLSNDEYMTIDFMVGEEPPEAASSPSSLAPPTTWEEWRPAGNDLNISGRQSPSFVQNALGKFGGQWALTTIPTLAPGGMGAPPERLIKGDAAERRTLIHENGIVVSEESISLATPAQIARINIRANLQSLKQKIVNEISAVYAATPPKRSNGEVIPFTNEQLVGFANNVANRYIRAVDEFLGSHPGAKPTLGARNGVLDWLGIQDSINSPWCADWALAIYGAMISMPATEYGAAFALSIVEPSLEFRAVQWNKSAHHVAGIQIQHNWIAIQAAGYPDLQTKTKHELDGQSLIYFDPWWDLLPRVRRPGDHDYLLTHWNPIP